MRSTGGGRIILAQHGIDSPHQTEEEIEEQKVEEFAFVDTKGEEERDKQLPDSRLRLELKKSEASSDSSMKNKDSRFEDGCAGLGRKRPIVIFLGAKREFSQSKETKVDPIASSIKSSKKNDTMKNSIEPSESQDLART